MKNILTNLLNNLNKNNIFKTYEALKANLSNTNYAGYLRDFYTKEEAQAYAVKINCNEYIEREWQRLEKQDDEAVLFLTNTLRFEKVDEQTMKNLINEMIEEMEATPVEEVKENQPETKGKTKAKGKAKGKAKAKTPTHRNTNNTKQPQNEKPLTEGEKLEKIQETVVEALRKIDVNNIIDFQNYVFRITKETISTAQPLEIGAYLFAYQQTGFMGFRTYINSTKIDEITPELIEEEVKKGYEKIKETYDSFEKQKAKEEKIKEIEKSGLKMTVEEIREIIEKLDQQTGFNGASLPIFISGRLTRTLAYYRHKRNGDPIEFKFSKKLLTYGTFEEIKDVIIHEYCHYWQHMIEGATAHNKNFKALCQKLGGSGSTYFSGFSLLGEAK